MLIRLRSAPCKGHGRKGRLAPTEAAGGSQTIIRALWVLRVLRDSGTDVGVTDVSRAVHMPSSTVHRILRTLVAAGYVVQNSETERCRLGREAYLLGRAAGHTLGFDAAMPLLEALADATGESVNLVVRDGGCVNLIWPRHSGARSDWATGPRRRPGAGGAQGGVAPTAAFHPANGNQDPAPLHEHREGPACFRRRPEQRGSQAGGARTTHTKHRHLISSSARGVGHGARASSV